jgi:hypothetical protein
MILPIFVCLIGEIPGISHHKPAPNILFLKFYPWCHYYQNLQKQTSSFCIEMRCLISRTSVFAILYKIILQLMLFIIFFNATNKDILHNFLYVW